MKITDQFRNFDAHVRHAGLGGGVSEEYPTADYTAYLGQWFFISHWSFADEKTSKVVQSVIAEAAAQSKPVMWRIYEPDGPENLSRTLRSHGFGQDSEDTLLVFDLKKPVAAPRYTAVPVRREHELDQFLNIMSRAFGEPLNLPIARRKVLLESNEVLSFFSCNGEEPLTAGQMDVAEGNPAVLLRGGSTIPEQRGKGGYSSMVLARLALAHELGKKLAFVEAGPSSRSILLSLGFEEVSCGKTWTFLHQE